MKGVVMAGQRVIMWTGGRPCPDADELRARLAKLPVFPRPAPLRRAALIEYQWGAQPFQILATACSLRTTPWGTESITWLHCKAMQTSAIKFDEPTSLIQVLIPAHYITRIEAGQSFQLTRTNLCEDLGVFPPNQANPANPLSPPVIEQVITDLLAPERN